ncbi:hypothetical protein RE628_12670 [Paenibacillus sp. D2_2]|nr:hypothetical protein [Paenibacillus sp. D2_2]WMT43044.1 hypothetical protein RE628_12670 [Paenibacillus sp. D2_2]
MKSTVDQIRIQNYIQQYHLEHLFRNRTVFLYSFASMNAVKSYFGKDPN